MEGMIDFGLSSGEVLPTTLLPLQPIAGAEAALTLGICLIPLTGCRVDT